MTSAGTDSARGLNTCIKACVTQITRNDNATEETKEKEKRK